MLTTKFISVETWKLLCYVLGKSIEIVSNITTGVWLDHNFRFRHKPNAKLT